MTDKISEVEQSRMVGQRTSIRAFNPNDQGDMERLQKIIQSPDTQKWMDGVKGMDLYDIKKWSKRRGKKWGRGFQHECMFAVSGSPGYVSDSEAWQIQGFINTYEVDEDDKKDLVEAGLFKENEDIFEVSYARNPQTKPGQVGSGLTQVCFRLNEMLGNSKSEETPSRPIIAFVDSNNINSVSVLKHSGFERIGRVDGNDVYKLNWLKAQSILHEEADKELVPVSKT